MEPVANLDFKAQCEECGESLAIKFRPTFRGVYIIVTTCAGCMSKAAGDIYDDGYMEGMRAGRDEKEES